jgi:hypothetical protein
LEFEEMGGQSLDRRPDVKDQDPQWGQEAIKSRSRSLRPRSPDRENKPDGESPRKVELDRRGVFAT